LPAFPFRAACDKTASEPDLVKKKGPDAALRVLADFADVYYNYSNALPCFDVLNENAGPNEKSASDATLWDWQYCSEMFMPTARDGVRDIFFPQPWNETRARETELIRRWIEEKHERISLRRDARDGAGKKNGFVSRTTFWRE
jgi:hypothetical protein